MTRYYDDDNIIFCFEAYGLMCSFGSIRLLCTKNHETSGIKTIGTYTNNVQNMSMVNVLQQHNIIKYYKQYKK